MPAYSIRSGLAAACVCLCALPALGQTYTYTAIALPNAIATLPSAVNSSGAVVGTWEDGSGVLHGFVYSGGTATSFDPAGAALTAPTGIADDGTVVGFYFDSSFVQHGFVYANGQSTILDYPKSTSNNSLLSISGTGEIVGIGEHAGTQLAFTYTAGKFKKFAVANDPLPTAVSSTGEVVGYYLQTATTLASFLYSGKGKAQLLEFPQMVTTHAKGVNASGTIVGQAEDSSKALHGFVYSKKAYSVLDIPGAHTTSLVGINASGVIAANAIDAFGNTTPYVYTNGGFKQLSVPNALSETAVTGINDAGQIVGAYSGSTGIATFIATPN